MPTVFDVANYFIVATRCDCEDEINDDVMTHMKLHKLVYYAQGFSLALNDEPLFDEPIEAWEHGPVCPDLYQKYKMYKRTPIESSLSMEEVKQTFTEKQIGVLEFVNDEFGCHTATFLRKLSHQDKAWLIARSKGGIELTLEDMKQSCLERLIDEG
ncbi:MAG: DUF4065 domain-containing protein [Deltaproteobacteria bacterium]|jgi:uncharacterized phage-associated protein|nr:DUF4065 domain-containing protein [Deltaproteobacteria bacterium]